VEIGVRKEEASENPKSGSHPSGAAMVLKLVNGENSLSFFLLHLSVDREKNRIQTALQIFCL